MFSNKYVFFRYYQFYSPHRFYKFTATLMYNRLLSIDSIYYARYVQKLNLKCKTIPSKIYINILITRTKGRLNNTTL